MSDNRLKIKTRMRGFYGRMRRSLEQNGEGVLARPLIPQPYLRACLHCHNLIKLLFNNESKSESVLVDFNIKSQ
jgi:hypothetical protein